MMSQHGSKAKKRPVSRTKKRAATETIKSALPEDPLYAATVIAEAMGISDDDRYRMIAERAYRNAVERRFRNGSPREDWLAAETEVDALLSNQGDD